MFKLQLPILTRGMSSNHKSRDPVAKELGSTFSLGAVLAVIVSVCGVAVHAFGIFGVQIVEHEQGETVDAGAFIRWSGEFTLSDALLLDPEPLYLPSSLNATSVYRPAAINTTAVPLFADFEPVIQLNASNVAPEPMGAGFAWDIKDVLAGSHWPAFQGAAVTAPGNELEQPPTAQKLKMRIDELGGEGRMSDVLAVEEVPEDFNQLWPPVALQVTISSDGQLLEPLLLSGSGYAELDQFIIESVMQAQSITVLRAGTYRITVSP